MLLNAYLFTLLSVCVLGSKPGGSDSTPKSYKAGVSWPGQEESSDPLNKFFPQGSKISWSFNWNKYWDSGLLSGTSKGFKLMNEFVPMFWTGKDADDLDLQGGYTHIMGFNEPDLTGVAVANSMSPEEAVTAWNKFASLRNDNVKLVSPGVAGDVTWLQRFYDNDQLQVKPDYIAVHAYALTFQEIKDMIDKYRGFGKPLWVTEIAMHSFGGPAPKDQQAVHDFMGQVTKWMDEDPQIERYAWFGALRNPEYLHDVHPFNRLMDEQGEITPLGWQYIWGGHK